MSKFREGLAENKRRFHALTMLVKFFISLTMHKVVPSRKISSMFPFGNQPFPAKFLSQQTENFTATDGNIAKNAGIFTKNGGMKE
jgi:hypothetical protein